VQSKGVQTSIRLRASSCAWGMFGANKMKVPNEGNDKGVVARQSPRTG